MYWFSKVGGSGSKIKPATPISVLKYKNQSILQLEFLQINMFK